jgi:hypothetical protein
MPESARNSITVVTGLPRSGTSLMMNMLGAGGMDLLVDDHRPADVNNVNGYFECTRVRNLERDPSFLIEAQGRAVKIVSPLLHALPQSHSYNVILMTRRLEEILLSQADMLPKGSITGGDDDGAMGRRFETHLAKARTHLASRERTRVLEVDYNGLVAHPEPWARRISLFLGDTLDLDGMVGVVDSSLYRHRC